MKKINKIIKNRLTDKLNFKNRYAFKRSFNRRNKNVHKIPYNLDNINYCLYGKIFKEYNDYNTYWYKNGKLHKDSALFLIKPAIKYHNGNYSYYKNNELISPNIYGNLKQFDKLKVFLNEILIFINTIFTIIKEKLCKK